MKAKQGGEHNLDIFEDKSNLSMKKSRRELSIDMVIHRGIFKNKKMTLFPCFTLPKTRG